MTCDLFVRSSSIQKIDIIYPFLKNGFIGERPISTAPTNRLERAETAPKCHLIIDDDRWLPVSSLRPLLFGLLSSWILTIGNSEFSVRLIVASWILYCGLLDCQCIF